MVQVPQDGTRSGPICGSTLTIGGDVLARRYLVGMQLGDNLVLTGFMGTGKTTVGRELAHRLGMDFVDTDELIESKYGPISRIFELEGESEFRSIERAVAAELGGRKGVIMATGGGMVLDPGSYGYLSRNGRFFCLVATPEAIRDRVSNDPRRQDRPLLAVDNPAERIVDLLSEREPGYLRFPQICTDGAPPEDIAEEIADLWQSQVAHEISHPSGECTVVVGVGILSYFRDLASIESPVVVVVADESVYERYGPTLGAVDLSIVLPVSGARSTSDSIELAQAQLVAAGIDRTATVVSLGTGAIRDVAAFASARHLGGVDLVHCPTGLTSMIDSRVRGESWSGAPAGAISSGVLVQPRTVVADVSTLQRLESRDLTAGLAVVLGLGLAVNGDLVELVEEGRWGSRESILPRGLAGLQALVDLAIQAEIEARNTGTVGLGRDIARGIEWASEAGMEEGDSMAMGLVAATRLSHQRGRVGLDLVDRVETLVTGIGLDPRLPEGVRAEDVLAGMRQQSTGGGARLHVVLPDELGSAFVADDVADHEVLDALRPG